MNDAYYETPGTGGESSYYAAPAGPHPVEQQQPQQPGPETLQARKQKMQQRKQANQPFLDELRARFQAQRQARMQQGLGLPQQYMDPMLGLQNGFQQFRSRFNQNNPGTIPQ
jgi:hypothetical protein